VPPMQWTPSGESALKGALDGHQMGTAAVVELGYWQVLRTVDFSSTQGNRGLRLLANIDDLRRSCARPSSPTPTLRHDPTATLPADRCSRQPRQGQGGRDPVDLDVKPSRPCQGPCRLPVTAGGSPTAASALPSNPSAVSPQCELDTARMHQVACPVELLPIAPGGHCAGVAAASALSQEAISAIANSTNSAAVR
jgi:hypothetical protein